MQQPARAPVPFSVLPLDPTVVQRAGGAEPVPARACSVFGGQELRSDERFFLSRRGPCVAATFFFPVCVCNFGLGSFQGFLGRQERPEARSRGALAEEARSTQRGTAARDVEEEVEVDVFCLSSTGGKAELAFFSSLSKRAESARFSGL